LYEESYDGISCRNASFNDVPICEEGEDVVSSTRRGRLCCCTRIISEEESDNNGISSCSDVGCKNVSNVKGEKCPSGLEFYKVEGVIPCCCTPGKFEDKDNFCQILGCESGMITAASGSAIPLPGTKGQPLVCSRSDLVITPISIINPQLSLNITNSCCCLGAVAMIEAITCSNYINCRELTGPECTSSFPSFDEINIDQDADGSIDRTFSCCCHAAKTE
jgi:hypothetical protein